MPLAVFLPRKTMPDRKYIINQNNFRNWVFIVCNKTKIAYKQAIKSQLDGLVIDSPVTATYTYWKPTKRRSDRNNVLTLHDKFLMDALVECGCMVDDSDEYVARTIFQGGELDRKNPRVEVLLEWDPEIKL